MQMGGEQPVEAQGGKNDNLSHVNKIKIIKHIPRKHRDIVHVAKLVLNEA